MISLFHEMTEEKALENVRDLNTLLYTVFNKSRRIDKLHWNEQAALGKKAERIWISLKRTKSA